MLFKFIDYSKLIGAYIFLGFKAQLEYRSAFFIELTASLSYDLIIVGFYIFFFGKFSMPNSWTAGGFAILWGLTSVTFGWFFTFFTNCFKLSNLITEGQLDVWLLYPRSLLLNIVISRFNIYGLSLLISGYTVFIVYFRPNILQIILFTVLSISTTIVSVGFMTIFSSLSFFIGNASAIATKARSVLADFACFPPELFRGITKIILFTLIPAAFISYLPAQSVYSLDVRFAVFSFLGALGFLALGIMVFYLGLKRYESGNSIQMRG